MEICQRRTFQVCIDILFGSLVTIVYFVTAFKVSPLEVGFFCDDSTIKYPFQEDTVRSEMVIGFIAIFPIILFLIVEGITFWRVRDFDAECVWHRRSTASAVKLFALFWFGVFAQKLTVEICKVSFGRLRPHFMDVCRPDFSQLNCSAGYITDYRCLNVDQPSLVAKARKSFPSGHTADVLYAAVFLGHYVHRRLASSYTLLLRQVVQLSLFAMALFTGLTRVTDHAHHLSDVIAGAAIGVAVAVWMVLCMKKSVNWKATTIATSQAEQPHCKFGMLRTRSSLYGACAVETA